MATSAVCTVRLGKDDVGIRDYAVGLVDIKMFVDGVGV